MSTVATLRRRAAGATRSWTPASLTGLAGWWTAADLSALADGAAVSSWADRSANGNTLTQATGSAQPVYVASGINSKPCVRFTGTSSQVLAKATPTGIPSNAAVQAIVICKITSSAADSGVVQMVDATRGWHLYMVGGTTLTWLQPGQASYNFSRGIPVNTPTVLSASNNGSGAILGQKNLLADDSSVAGVAIPALTSPTFTIGGGQFARYLTGDVAEVIVLSTIMGSADRLALCRYIWDRYSIRTGTPWNATAATSTASADGSNTCIEPSIYYNPSTKFGHKWWLSFVPLGGAGTVVENPHIMVSDDGTTFAAPAGVTNPVVAQPVSGNNADPHLMLAQDGKFYLFYNRNGTSPTEHGVYVVSSADGTTWDATPGTLLINTAVINTVLEPTVVWDGTQYVMYTINSASAPIVLERRTSSSPLGTWSAATVCTVALPGSRTPWHIDVQVVGSQLILCCSDNDGGASTGGNFWFGSTPISDGLTFSMKGHPVMVPSAARFDSGALYRPSFYYDSAAGNYKLYYGASGGTGNHLGIATIPTSEVI